METNAVAVWWYWWVRAREGMRHIDSAGGGRQIMVNFQATGADGETAHRTETRVRFVPMPALASHTAADTGGAGPGPRDADAEEGGPYESRYEAWLRGLSEHSRRFVEHEGRAARHCSALLYRFNRPLWRAIDQGLSDTVTDLLEAGMRDGRIEARVVDRIQGGLRRGREVQFVRTGAGAPLPGTPLVPAPRTPSQCDDIILNNRKMYTPASLRQIPLATRETTSLTKSGRRRHRARRYRAPPRLVVPVPAPPDDSDTENDDGGDDHSSEEDNAEGVGVPNGTVHPLQLWPRASYVRDTSTYL